MADTPQESRRLSSRDQLQKLAGGRFFDELDIAFARVADEVLALGKKGSVTIKLEFDRPHAGSLMLTVKESVAVSMPKPPGTGAVFFYHEGGFHENDPRQAAMPELQVVEPKSEKRAMAPVEQEVRKPKVG
jgi:hypothetical protein